MAFRTTVTRFSNLISPLNVLVKDYEAAIDALNGLQSNAQYLTNARAYEKHNHAEERARTILTTQKFLFRSGINLNRLNDLKVVHVTGTKGKGSTCAFCESILRHNGLTTGFFSSPHLLEVRERIKINGSSISKTLFASYFWELYETLHQQKESDEDIPAYFMFLTILALKIFLEEKVNVAVIEVGIGGEFDCTNIVQNVPVVGITPLDLEHTRLLGSSIQEIAWQKAGIFKKDCVAYTVPQLDEVIEVFKSRSIERNIKKLHVLTENEDIAKIMNVSLFPTKEIELNANLAVVLSKAFLKQSTVTINGSQNFEKNAKTGIINCKWPARYQKLQINNKTYFIDGAHTIKSIELCKKWFEKQIETEKSEKVLIFNATGERNSQNLLKILQEIKFDKVIFVPNVANLKKDKDNINYNIPESEQVTRCKKHQEIWTELDKNAETFVFNSVGEILASNTLFCDNRKYNILITGSLHLAGAFLSIVDPNLQCGNLLLQNC